MRGQAKVVALTFDDGPTRYSGEILDVLEAHGVRGTFFLVGKRVEKGRSHVVRMVEGGHEVANHTFSHSRIEELSPEEVRRELRSASDVIEAAAGVRPTLFRPPYGLGGLQAMQTAKELGMTTVRWNVNSRDWDGSDEHTIARRVLEAVLPGAVVLLHDGGGPRESTTAAVRALVPELEARGFTFLTVSEIIERSYRARRQVIVTHRGLLRRAIGQTRAMLRESVPIVALT